MMLLDFVSLLESNYKRQPAEGTISAFLQKTLPVGSLAAENWEPSKDKKAQQLREEEQQHVTNGWKSESFSKAADSLLAAATRLRDDVKKETKYWEQILSVQQEGWTMFKSPLERAQLGVQTASIEAGPLFRERGLITLKADRDGHIRLKHLAATEPKMIRVRIKRNGTVVSTSKGLVEHPEEDEESDGHVPLGTRLKHARDSLFEEELYHEMIIETRNLAPHAVEARNGMIHFNSSPRTTDVNSEEIVVDLISQYSDEHETSVKESNDRAQSIALALRLLLSNFHQQRLKRRTNRPLPMTLKPRPEPNPLIIMPLLTSIRHQYAVKEVEDVLQSFSVVLQNAGFPSKLQRTTSTRDGSEKASSSSTTRTAASALSLRLSESFILELPSSSTTIEGITTTKYNIVIEVDTLLVDGPISTIYFVELPTPLTTKLYTQSFGASKRMQMTDAASMFAQVTNFISLDVIYNILAIRFSSWAPKGSDPWLTSTRTAEGKEGKTRETSIFVRMIHKEIEDTSPSTAEVHNVSLVVHRSAAGKLGLAETVKWDTAQSERKLVDVVAGWISKWETN
jgi:mediator of RNA polymerase II transcription subunit 17